jgi:hypothetical protein
MKRILGIALRHVAFVIGLALICSFAGFPPDAQAQSASPGNNAVYNPSNGVTYSTGGWPGPSRFASLSRVPRPSSAWAGLLGSAHAVQETAPFLCS